MEFEGRLRDRHKWAVGDACSVSRVLDLLSTKTVFLVVRECFYGTTRFEDFMEQIGTSAPALSRALKQLEAAKIVTRVPYQEPGKRVHDEYRLTEAVQHNHDGRQLRNDRQDGEYQRVQNHLITLQAVLQSLSHRAGLPLEMEAQWQLDNVSEQPLAQRA